MSAAYSVSGKTAIVTGGGSDLNLQPEAEKVYSSFAKGSPRAVFLKTDVTDWGDLSRAFEKADEEFGDIDIVCPGAGIFEPFYSSFWHPPGAAGSKSVDPVDGLGHYKLLDINVTHPIRATQLAMSYFLNPTRDRTRVSQSNPKRIIHVASVASETAALTVPMYIASKWAISGFVRSLAQLDEIHGIKVSAVAPGMVRTPLWLNQTDKITWLDESKDVWVTPDEVALAMLKNMEDPAIVSGSVIEVGHNQTRDIPLYGNTGPKGDGYSLSNAAAGFEETLRTLGADGWGVVSRK